MTSGVIDPTKVTRTALQNAASIAGLLLTTECVVVERKEDKPAPGGGPPGSGMSEMYKVFEGGLLEAGGGFGMA